MRQIWGFTSMPFFGKVHKCKQYEQWSGIKVQTMRGMK